MYVIIGGNGKTGSRVAARLRQAGHPVRLASRSTTPVFDWEDPTTWPAAFEGADAAYVTYYPDLAFPGVSDTVRDLAAAAKRAGLRKLVLLSGRGEDGALASENEIKNSGLAFTIVRCNWFNQNFSESFFLDAVRSGSIAIPAGEAVEPFVDADDIADVVTASLVDAKHDGETYVLSGPELLSFAQVAEELSQAVGRRISYAPVTPEEYATMLRQEGLDEGFVDLFSLILDGRNASLTDGVQRAVGRQPRRFAEFARQAAASGVWG